jgi:hypothetical protein
MKYAIETHKAFPIVAWGVFITFAAFTFYLATELQSSSTQLQLSERTAENLEALQSTP